MVLLRPQAVVAAAAAKPPARFELSTLGLQLVQAGRVAQWAKKAAWFRNTPYTVGPWAHPGQIEIRLMFAEAAGQARGQRGLVETPKGLLPPAAAEVLKKLTGKTAPHRMDPAKYPSRLRRTAYTAAELATFAARMGLATPAVVRR